MPVPFAQVSSMLGSTYDIPWPPFYESILNTMAVVNIDVSMIRFESCPVPPPVACTL